MEQSNKFIKEIANKQIISFDEEFYNIRKQSNCPNN